MQLSNSASITIDSPTSESHDGADTKNTHRSDFSVIWHNLTYRVDSRPWYTKAKENCFPRSGQDGGLTEDGLAYGPESSTRGKERVILNRICGEARSRQLTGILGPSGSGKSSMLHCLFQNRTVGTSGRILVDGFSKKKLKVCFIPQKDFLNDWLTVREDLIFVSRLKFAKTNGFFSRNVRSTQSNLLFAENSTYVKQEGGQFNTSLIDHESNATQVAELLGLENCLDVQIKNISGGQKKRLSIARELMSQPNILILDEPTTGLDSLTCYKTMLVLQNLAHRSAHPMAVIVTIHQPPLMVFNLFDKTYFLSNRGRVIYDDHPKNAVETLKQIAKTKLPTPNYNPASTLIEIASECSLKVAEEQLANHQVQKFHEKYDVNYIKFLMQPKSKNGNQYAHNRENQSLSSEATNERYQPVRTPVSNSKEAATPSEVNGTNTFSDTDYHICYQLRDCLSSHSSTIAQSFRHISILTHRSWLSIVRNPTMTRTRLAFHMFLPLFMLCIFGTSSGGPNNCPKIDAEYGLQDMKNNLKEATISRNFEETRLSVENVSFFFILMYGFGINIISCTASVYPLTIHMFKKETINGLYSAGPYFLGQMIAELPIEIIFPASSVMMAYTLSGQISSYLEWRMFAVTAMFLLTCYVIHGLGLLFGSIFINNVSVAVLMGQVSLLPPVILSGFLIRSPRMSDWMHYLAYTSFFQHGIKGITASRYGFNVCECDEDMLPEEGSTFGFKGLPPNVKHVLEYMFPKNDTDDLDVTQMFDKLGEDFSKAQTFGRDIKSCDDVKPFLMIAFGVEDSDMYLSACYLFISIVVVRLLTFYIIKTSPHRIE